MLHLTEDTRILLALEPVDFRRQIDGLVAVVKHVLLKDARSGQLFVFINRAHTMIRVLCFDQTGYWLATKRLSRGRYALWPTTPGTTSCRWLASDLQKLLKTGVATKRTTL